MININNVTPRYAELETRECDFNDVLPDHEIIHDIKMGLRYFVEEEDNYFEKLIEKEPVA